MHSMRRSRARRTCSPRPSSTTPRAPLVVLPGHAAGGGGLHQALRLGSHLRLALSAHRLPRRHPYRRSPAPLDGVPRDGVLFAAVSGIVKGIVKGNEVTLGNG